MLLENKTRTGKHSMLLHVIQKTNTFPFWIFFHARCSFSALLILHHTSSLTSPRSISPPTQIWNFLKFWAIFLSAPCQSSPYLLRRLSPTIEASNPLLHRVNSLILKSFLSRKPQNHRRANEMMDLWPQMLSCDPDPGHPTHWEWISFQGWDNNRFRVTDAPDPDIGQNIGCKFTDCWRLFMA